MPGLSPNAGISSNGGDSHFIDCIVVDYTIGFEMLIDSVNYLLDSYDIILTDCYADTGMTGYLVKQNTRLRGCSYFNNYTYGMDDVTVIDHRGGSLLVSEGLFRKTSPHATLYKGDNEHVQWANNTLDGEFDDL